MRFDLLSQVLSSFQAASGALPLYADVSGGLKLVGSFTVTPGGRVSCFAEVEPWLDLLGRAGYKLFFTPRRNDGGLVVSGILSEAPLLSGSIPVEVTF